MKTLIELAKELEFNSEEEYLEYIVNSYINWNKSQFRNLVLELRNINKLSSLIDYINGNIENETKNELVSKIANIY